MEIKIKEFRLYLYWNS